MTQVTVTTRTGKGSTLTTAEMDANLSDLASAVNFLLPNVVAFSATIPFTGNVHMSPQAVTGAIAFSANVAGATEGAQTVAHLIADGSNAPTFGTEFREWGGSSGYDNRSGIRNVVNFWYEGGVYWYSVGQALGAVAEALPASALLLTGPSSSVVGSASTNFTVQTNGVTTGSIVVTPSDGGAGGTFTPTTRTLSAGTNSSGTFTYTAASTGTKSISVTNNGGLSNPSALSLNVLAAPTAPGAPTSLTAGSASATAIPLTWAAPASNGGAAITDYVVQWSPAGAGTWTTFADGTSTATGTTVTGLTASTSYDFRVAAVNLVGQGSYSATTTASTSAAAALRATSITGLDESGSSASWSYSTNVSTWFATKSVCDKSLAIGADGWVEFTITRSGGGCGMGFRAGNSSAGLYSDSTYGVTCAPSYGVLAAGSFGSPTTARTVANGDYVRLQRTGTTLEVKISSNGGSSYTTIHTWTGVSTSSIWYVNLYGDGAGCTMADLRASGLS